MRALGHWACLHCTLSYWLLCCAVLSCSVVLCAPYSVRIVGHIDAHMGKPRNATTTQQHIEFCLCLSLSLSIYIDIFMYTSYVHPHTYSRMCCRSNAYLWASCYTQLSAESFACCGRRLHFCLRLPLNQRLHLPEWDSDVGCSSAKIGLHQTCRNHVILQQTCAKARVAEERM